MKFYTSQKIHLYPDHDVLRQATRLAEFKRQAKQRPGILTFTPQDEADLRLTRAVLKARHLA